MPTDGRRQLSSFTADGEMINLLLSYERIKAAFACLLRADGIRPYGAYASFVCTNRLLRADGIRPYGACASFVCRTRLLRADGIRPYGADVRLSSVGEDIILPIPFSGKSEKIYAYHLYGIVLRNK